MKLELCCGWLLVATLAAGSVPAQTARPPIYKPPDPLAPKVRADGHSRGTDDAVLTLTVLAPEHVGQTTKDQPSLFWYQPRPAKTRFELTISEPKAVSPLLEVKL